MELELIQYGHDHFSQWDAFCKEANNATFIQSRLFLSYHGDRFKDESVMIFESGKLVGLLPAAQAPGDRELVVSHPGITYGGLIHDGWLSGERTVLALERIREFYRAKGYSRLLYKALPHGYARVPSQDDIYALFRSGAAFDRCNLSCTIDLATQRPLPERRRRGLKKALKASEVTSGPEHLARLWEIVEDNLRRKHDATPVHSLAEMQELLRRFPAEIELRCASVAGTVEAGVVLFKFPRLWHAQYIASSEVGYDTSALDGVFNSAIEDARASGAQYFDFGTSNEDGGLKLNDGLYRFKSEFGGGGMAHPFFLVNV